MLEKPNKKGFDLDYIDLSVKENNSIIPKKTEKRAKNSMEALFIDLNDEIIGTLGKLLYENNSKDQSDDLFLYVLQCLNEGERKRFLAQTELKTAEAYSSKVNDFPALGELDDQIERLKKMIVILQAKMKLLKARRTKPQVSLAKNETQKAILRTLVS